MALVSDKYLHALNCAAGSWKTLDLLWKRFSDWTFVFQKAGPGELKMAGVSEDFVRRLIIMRKSFDVEKEFAELWQRDIVIVSRQHSGYPYLLSVLPDAPYLLYQKGAPLAGLDPGPRFRPNRLIDHGGQRAVAIVGTRNPSEYGKKVASELADAITIAEVTIVSGLAFGIDAVAHLAAVRQKRPTIAVLGSGLYHISPAAHHRLADEILSTGGTIISEYPPSTPAYPSRFLERNRIIAGLSEAVVIIEAGERSGALATARLANEYNRDVYALPGDITREQAQGCLKLLSDGAIPLLSSQKFLDDLGISSSKTCQKLTLEEEQILKILRTGPVATDEIAEKTGLSASTLNIFLMELELKKLIHRNGDFLWERRNIRPP